MVKTDAPNAGSRYFEMPYNKTTEFVMYLISEGVETISNRQHSFFYNHFAVQSFCQKK